MPLLPENLIVIVTFHSLRIHSPSLSRSISPIRVMRVMMSRTVRAESVRYRQHPPPAISLLTTNHDLFTVRINGEKKATVAYRWFV